MKKLLILLLLIPINVRAYSSSATSTVLMDMDSLNVIYGKNMHEIRRTIKKEIAEGYFFRLH